MKKSQLTLKEDNFKTVTSTFQGHNIDGMAFNIGLMAKHGHFKEVKQLQKIYESLPLYEEAKQ